MTEPTAFPELNEVLSDLVVSAAAILGDNLCGAYLQGSFAVGDADEHSDVDFAVVTNSEVTSPQLAALQTMHARLFAFDIPWAQHLEGSYIPKGSLRRFDPVRRPYLYLDNGSSALEWDDHDNTEVVRWTLREYGICLFGPKARSLVDPVSADRLRAELVGTVGQLTDWACEPGEMSRWKQPNVALFLCRMLHTLSSGRFASKKAGGEWALTTLDAERSGLIQHALDDRPNPWGRVRQRAEPATARRTLAFVSYALDEAGARYG